MSEEGCAGGGAEEVAVGKLERKGEGLVGGGGGIGRHAGDDWAGLASQVEVGLCAHWLDEFNHRLEPGFGRGAKRGGRADDVFGADAQDYGLANVAPQPQSEGGIQRERERSWGGGRRAWGFLRIR